MESTRIIINADRVIATFDAEDIEKLPENYLNSLTFDDVSLCTSTDGEGAFLSVGDEMDIFIPYDTLDDIIRMPQPMVYLCTDYGYISADFGTVFMTVEMLNEVKSELDAMVVELEDTPDPLPPLMVYSAEGVAPHVFVENPDKQQPVPANTWNSASIKL